MQLRLVTEPARQVLLPGQLFSAAVDLSGVNWEREIAVVVDMGEKPTGGYAVKVTGIDLAGAEQVFIDLHLTQPGPGDMVTQAFTHPHAVARIPRVGLRPGEMILLARDQRGREVARQVVQL